MPTVLLLLGCGGAGSEEAGEASSTTASNPTITTKTEAEYAANTIAIVSGLAQTNESVSNSSNAKQREAVDSTSSCATSGHVSTKGDISLISTNLTFEYVACSENGVLMNGSTTASGTLINLDMKMIDLSVDTSEFYSLSNLDINIATSFQTVRTSFDGKVAYNDKLNKDVGSVLYSDFKVVSTDSLLGSTTIEYNGETTLESSKYACVDGIYTYKTLTPLASSSDGIISSGELDINGAIYSFSDEGIEVTLTNGESYMIEQNSEISCE